MNHLILSAGLLLGAGTVSGNEYDLIIRGGEIVDGTGAVRYQADIGVRNDRIAAIGDLAGTPAGHTIDARGLIVTPGFIDLHTHGDDERFGPRGLRSPDVRRRAAQNYVTQGVTTMVVNPDGSQARSLREQRAQLTQLGTGTNVVLFNGHNTLRSLVMGEDVKRPATESEIARMRELLHEGLYRDGSFGLSLGLEYFSGLHSTPDEVLELAKTLSDCRGVFIPHLRSQGIAPMWYKPSEHGAVPPPTLEQAIDEVLRVARETRATVVFTHMKAWGPGYRGQAGRWIERIEAVRREGARVYMDVYPYDSSGSDGSFCALPAWAIGESAPAGKDTEVDHAAALRQTLAQPGNYERLEQDVLHQLALKGGAENVRLLDYPQAAYIGRTYADLMQARKLDETALAIALQLEGNPILPGGAKMRSFSMAEQDIEEFYRQPWCATTTDGWIVLPEEAVGPFKYIGTNRRCFGSFPRRISYYALERGVDSLEQAVRSCSGLPAEILGLKDRGRIAVGMKADLAILNLRTLKDNTTFMEPNLYASGVEHVLVNGVAVVRDEKPTLALPGIVLEPPGRPVEPGVQTSSDRSQLRMTARHESAAPGVR